MAQKQLAIARSEYKHHLMSSKAAGKDLNATVAHGVIHTAALPEQGGQFLPVAVSFFTASVAQGVSPLFGQCLDTAREGVGISANLSFFRIKPGPVRK